jgi:phosphoribosylformylglycinamidine synthase
VPPSLDLRAEAALQKLLVRLATERLIRSAHDCAEGGFAVALAECCFDTGSLGADVSIEGVSVSLDQRMNLAATLFGESATRVIVSTRVVHSAAVLSAAEAAGVPAGVVGQTGGEQIRISVDGRRVIDVAVDEAEQAWATAIGRRFERKAA